MNNLLNTRCYLAGAIEKKKDNGCSWRSKVKTDLIRSGIHWLDPCDKPMNYAVESPLTIREMKLNRANNKVDLIKDHYGIVRSVDSVWVV